MPPVEYTKEYFDKQIDLLVRKLEMHAYDPKVDGECGSRGVRLCAEHARRADARIRRAVCGAPGVAWPSILADLDAGSDHDRWRQACCTTALRTPRT